MSHLMHGFAALVAPCSKRSKRAPPSAATPHAGLHSTETAHRFYLANGYVDAGEPIRKFGMNSGYPMSKRIAP